MSDEPINVMRIPLSGGSSEGGGQRSAREGNHYDFVLHAQERGARGQSRAVRKCAISAAPEQEQGNDRQAQGESPEHRTNESN